jgi:hypothetical protein
MHVMFSSHVHSGWRSVSRSFWDEVFRFGCLVVAIPSDLLRNCLVSQGLLTEFLNLRFERQEITIFPELPLSPTAADGGSCSSTVYGSRHVGIRQDPVNFTHSPEHHSASLSKKELIELVERQFDLWPHESFKWAPKRDTTVKVLRNVLLSPDFGFGKVGKWS